MYEESVITPVAAVNEVYYIVPRSLEDTFVDLDCDVPKYEYARLDLMLEIVNGYKQMQQHTSDLKTDNFHIERGSPLPGVLAKVTPLHTVN